MQDLIDFSQRPDVQNFIGSSLSEGLPQKGLHSVFIGRHDYWRDIVDFEILRKLRPDFFAHFRPFYSFGHRQADWDLTELYMKDAFYHNYIRNVDDHLPGDVYSWARNDKACLLRWERFHIQLKKTQKKELDPEKDPYVIIFKTQPGALANSQFRSLLFDIINGAKFFVVVQETPVPTLLSGSGSSTGMTMSKLEGGLLIRTSAGQEGTLGGFLKEGRSGVVGNPLGVTCSHVAKKGDDVEYWDERKKSWSVLGSCVHSSPFSPHKSSGVNCYKNTNAIDVDFALIKLDSSIVATNRVSDYGEISEIIRPQNIPSKVMCRGGASGAFQMTANKFGTHCEMKLPSGEFQCFRDIFELEPPRSRFLSLNATTAKHKDSGGFIMAYNAMGAYSLCGQIIAGDGKSTFASFAQNSVDSAAAFSKLSTL